MPQLVTISGGGFQDSGANPLANGTVTVDLQVDIVLSLSQICAGRQVTLTLDTNGNVTGSPTLWGPATYFLTAYSAVGQPSGNFTISVPDASSFSLTP
jgi:hypothetical protein